jgi:hypothetical protein
MQSSQRHRLQVRHPKLKDQEFHDQKRVEGLYVDHQFYLGPLKQQAEHTL